MNVLKQYEADIEEYQRSYEKASRALLAIHDGDLWADEDYQGFDQYCAERWGFKKSRAYQLLEAGRLLLTCEDLSVDPPENERIAREVLKVKAFDRVGEKADGSPIWEVNEEKTAQKRLGVLQAVRERLQDEPPTAEAIRYHVDVSSGRGANAGPTMDKQKKQALSQLWRAMDRVIGLRWDRDEKSMYGEQIRSKLNGWL